MHGNAIVNYSLLPSRKPSLTLSIATSNHSTLFTPLFQYCFNSTQCHSTMYVYIPVSLLDCEPLVSRHQVFITSVHPSVHPNSSTVPGPQQTLHRLFSLEHPGSTGHASITTNAPFHSQKCTGMSDKPYDHPVRRQ